MTKIILGNGNNLSVSDDNSNGDTIIVGNGVGDSVDATTSATAVAVTSADQVLKIGGTDGGSMTTVTSACIVSGLGSEAVAAVRKRSGSTATAPATSMTRRYRQLLPTPTRRPHRGDRGGPAGEPVGRAAAWPAGDQSVQ